MRLIIELTRWELPSEASEWDASSYPRTGAYLLGNGKVVFVSRPNSALPGIITTLDAPELITVLPETTQQPTQVDVHRMLNQLTAMLHGPDAVIADLREAAVAPGRRTPT